MPVAIKHLTDRRVIYNSLLARWKDGLYYTAVLTKCDRANKKCRVCFEDGSEIWVSTRDVHVQLTLDQLSEDEDIVCCICDDGASEPPNEIILCDVCQQGYHQNCHIPTVDASKLDDSEDTKDHKDWFCATCSFILNQTNRAKLSATVAAAQQEQQKQHDRPTRANSSSAPSISTQPRAHDSKTQASTSQTPVKPKPAPPQTVIATPIKAAVAPGLSPAAAAAAPPPQPPPVAAAPTAVVAASPEKTAPNKQVPIVKQPPKVKQTPTLQQASVQKSSVGPVKPGVTQHQRSAPYYPLSSQARVMATSSTAALASLTASSAITVGSPAGRTKQDLVKQSNRSTQRQINNETASSTEVSSGVPKHAVRKSSVNFSPSPVKQSALPVATRSLPTSGATITVTKTITTPAARATVTARPVITMSLPQPAVSTTTSQTANSSYTIMALTNQSKATDEPAKSRASNDVGNSASYQPPREQRSVISTISSSQQASGRPVASVTETAEQQSDASSCISTSSQNTLDKSGNAHDEHNMSNISNNRTFEQGVIDPQKQTADTTRSSTDSGNCSIPNKPTTVIVGGSNLD